MADNKEYVIDVSKRHKYYNQSRRYQKEYQEWRSAKDNPYGYRFIKDSREHAYVDGEGYLDNTGIDEEKTALFNCFRLLGMSLLIMGALALVRMIIMDIAFGLDKGGRIYYETLESGSFLSSNAAYMLAALNLLEYLLPIFFLSATTRLPTRVAVPMKRVKGSVYFSVVLVMLLMMFAGRTINILFANGLNMISIYSLYYDYIAADDPVTLAVCGFSQHIIIPILIEIFYRGFLLQLFRQFGEMFAIIVTSVASVWMLHDLTQIGYLFIVSIFTGIITVRTGSLKPACLMRVSARVLTFAITLVRSSFSFAYGEIFELLLMIAVFFGCVFYYKRMGRKSFKLSIGIDDETLSIRAKLRLMLMSAPVWAGFVAMLVITILTIKVD